MKRIIFPLAIAILFILASCGSQSSEEKATEKACVYAYDTNTKAQVKWTAFKTTQKVPVGGLFDEVIVTSGRESGEITDVLNGLSFRIPTASTNTTNPDRDAKIVKSFFGAMTTTDFITGKVKSSKGNNTFGTCVVLITLNQVEKELALDYSIEEEKVLLTGEIDVHDFGAQNAVASLNEICKDLHTGTDGVSKTWSTVELAVELYLDKMCD